MKRHRKISTATLAALLLPMSVWCQEPEIAVELPGGVPLKMVWIDPGTFLMGSPEDEVGAAFDEKPQHPVTLTQGFYLGKDDFMNIRLDEARQGAISRALGEFYREAFDEDLSAYQAQRLLEFFVEHLGPPVYNQAVQDARSFMLDRLDDLEGEIYKPEKPV